MQLATSAAEVEQAMRAGKVASLIGMEGGGSIGSSLGVLRQMHALGARYLTLVHYKTIGWGDSSNDVPTNGGLSPFGLQVVREMQRLGMLVDLSHTSADVMIDALDVARAPVMFSHSNARTVDGHPRNVPDDVLDRLKANRGIIMVTAVNYFVSEDLRQWRALRAAEEARLNVIHVGYPDRVKPALDMWLTAHPQPLATLGQLADHIDHIVRRIGPQSRDRVRPACAAFGQCGNEATAGSAFGSVHAGPWPFVQPDSSTSPFAFDQPPPYQPQSTFAALSRSPIVGCVCGGSFGANTLVGCHCGSIVFTA